MTHLGGATSGALFPKLWSGYTNYELWFDCKNIISLAGLPNPSYNTWTLEAFNSLIALESPYDSKLLYFDN